jgi:arylformamidase
MKDITPEFQYITGQIRTGFGPLLAEFEKQNVQALSHNQWELDVPYGQHPRQTFDVCSSNSPAKGTVIYFHAGYWQSRDKAQFRFLARDFNALGWHVVLVNYPLCPEVSVPEIVKSANEAIRQIVDHQLSKNRVGPLVLSGHSAGAHLVVEIALHLARTSEALRLPLAGVLPISGIFELEPLVMTTLNQRLKLDSEQARLCSPVHRVSKDAVPALFLVGETETPAFHAQSRDMALAWQAQGNQATLETLKDADHFSILSKLCVPQGKVDLTLQDWAQQKSH